jgi:hypothetical protein
VNSRLRRALTVLSAAVLTISGTVVLSPPASADPAQTYYVYPDGDNSNSCLSAHSACATIQSAVDKAAAGDTVKVGAGSYAETISITKAMTLQPDGDATPSIDGGVTVGDANGAVTISGFAISGSSAPALVSVTDSVATDIVTISDNSFSGANSAAQTGIDVSANTSATITDNTFTFGDAGGAAISLTANDPDPLNVTLGGNSGSVIAPTRTINEAGTVDVTPTGTPNTIQPHGASLEFTDFPTQVVDRSTTPVGFSGTADSGGIDLPHARYDIAIASATDVDSADITLTYGNDDQPVPLAGDTNGTDVITGYFGPFNGFPFAAGAVTTPFHLSIAGTTVKASLSVVTTLDEVATPDGSSVVNSVASATSTVDVVHTPVAPSPQDGGATGFNKATVIALQASDADGDSLTYSVASQPTHGTVAINAATATYTPTKDDHGPDSFTFTASDGTLVSEAATVNVTVNADQVPAATSQANVAVAFGQPKTITLAGTDGDNDALTFAITTQPTHGTLSTVSGSSVIYTPTRSTTAANDSFAFTANDGVATSTPATVTLNVAADQVPAATTPASPVSVAFGKTKTVTLTGTDGDNDALTFAIASPPTHGTLSSVTPGPNNTATVVYTPTSTSATAGGFTDSFTFTANDGFATSTPATVTLNVAADHIPAATAPSNPVPVAFGQPKSITLAGTDVDNDALTFAIASQPTHGTLVRIDATTVRYTPTSTSATAGGFTDSFTFTANDGFATSTPATVTLSVAADHVPAATGQASVAVAFGKAKTITLSGTDGDNDALTFAIASQPTHGTLSAIRGSTVTYTPTRASPAAVADSFTFTANDGFATSTPATVTLHVAADGVPSAPSRQYSATVGGAVAITLTSDDPDGDAVTFTHGAPTKGTLSGTGAKLTYRAPASFAGDAHFTYTAKDRYGAARNGTVTIHIAKAAAKVASVSFSPKRPTSAHAPKATVTVSSVGTVTGGVVTITYGANKRTAPVKRGRAIVTLTRMTGGTHRLTVTFGGTSTTTSAAKTLSLTVSKVATTMSVKISPSQLTTTSTGKAVVTITASGAQINGKQVMITENSRIIASGTVSRGVATMALPKFALGQHNLTVSYPGTTTATAVTKTVILRVALG